MDFVIITTDEKSRGGVGKLHVSIKGRHRHALQTPPSIVSWNRQQGRRFLLSESAIFLHRITVVTRYIKETK